MNLNYTSFLVCFHPEQINLYVCGLPLAVVKGDNVVLQKTNPLQLTHDAKFEDLNNLKAALIDCLDKVKVELEKQGQ
jgi:hypothetical protein